MMKHSARRIAAAGATTGLALALVGAITPLAATAAENEVAPTQGFAYDAKAQSLLDADHAVQAVGVDGEGDIVVYANADKELAASTQAFLDRTENSKVLEVKGTFSGLAAGEVVGGAGYGYPTGDGMVGLCSIGFSAWTPEGKPGFVSAGHCTDDGAATDVRLTVPSLDAAGGTVDFMDSLAKLSFSQFGGPGNSDGAENDITSVDFSAFEVTNPELKMLPEVTDWTTASSDDLAASTSVISSVGDAELGPMKRSGRTTGQQEGDVLQLNTWFRVTMDYSPQGRYVHGFITDAHSDHGDSGGSIWQGEKAVGVVSAGGELTDGTKVMLGADLEDGLALTGGYTIMLHIDAPTVATSGDVTVGDPITGTAPAGTEVIITPASGDPITVKTDTSGKWSFPAPSTTGAFEFTVVAKKGFDTSESAAGSVNIVKAPLKAPAITTPADGATVETEVTAISGTGLPGATVTLGGDVAPAAGAFAAQASIVVGADGTWTVPVSLTYGDHTVTATQELDGEVSPKATTSFAVVPVAPAITAPTAGAVDEEETPGTASGTGVEGATVTITLDGKEIGTATVTDGEWTLALPESIAVGKHELKATQTIEGKTSAAATVAFEVTSDTVEPTPTPVPTDPTATPTPVPTETGTPTPAPTSTSPALPATGVADSAPALLAGLGLLIAGGALFVARRLRLARR